MKAKFKWRNNITPEDHLDHLYNEQPLPQISLEEMGFKNSELSPKELDLILT